MLNPSGIYVPVVTPFDASGNVNFTVLKELVQHFLACGADGFLALGATGEFYSLDSEESRQVTRTIVEVVGGAVPVLVGSGGESTKKCLETVRMAEQEGGDGLCFLTPYFIAPNDNELYDFFSAIADSTELPVVLYGNPGRCGGIGISAKLVERLAAVPNIVGIKDSSGDLTLAQEYLTVVGDHTFHLLAGRDTLILPSLLMGAVGAIAGQANIMPKELFNLMAAWKQGDVETAKEEQMKVVKLRSTIGLGSFPSVTKAAMNLIGFDVGPPRPPIAGLSDDALAKLRVVMGEIGLL